MTLTSRELVRLLAGEDRRRLVAALVLADDALSARALADATGLELRSVVDAANRLVSAGLVRLVDGDHSLDEAAFEVAARAEVEPVPASAFAGEPAEVARVLDTAFVGGRLVQWPAKRAKRLIVLDHLSQVFDIGKRYKEAEVNERLRVFNDDVATMRRYLVDEQYLDRTGGEYWRCGGSV